MLLLILLLQRNNRLLRIWNWLVSKWWFCLLQLNFLKIRFSWKLWSIFWLRILTLWVSNLWGINFSLCKYHFWSLNYNFVIYWESWWKIHCFRLRCSSCLLLSDLEIIYFRPRSPSDTWANVRISRVVNAGSVRNFDFKLFAWGI